MEKKLKHQKENIRITKEMENVKNIIIIQKNYYSKETINMVKEMEKEQNMILIREK